MASPAAGAEEVVIVFEALAVLHYASTTNGALHTETQQCFQLDLVTFDGVRLTHVLLDALQRRAFAFTKLAHRFGDDLAEIGAARNMQRPRRQAVGVFVAALALVEYLEHITLPHGHLQPLGDDILMIVVMLADRVANALDARPLLLRADLADGVKDPARPDRLRHVRLGHCLCGAKSGFGRVFRSAASRRWPSWARSTAHG